MEASSSSAYASDAWLAGLPFTGDALLGDATDSAAGGLATATTVAAGTGAVNGTGDGTGAGAGGVAGLLLMKLVDEPKMSGKGSPRTGRLEAPAGKAKGVGDCKRMQCVSP